MRDEPLQSSSKRRQTGSLPELSRHIKAASMMKAAGLVSALTLLSRVLGLVREQVFAALLGAGFYADAFNTAFRIPNLLRDLFAEGALSSAFVPTFTATKEHEGPEAAWRLANRLFTLLLVLLGAVTVVIALGAPFIMGVYGAGFAPDKLALAVAMTRILSPFLLAVAAAAAA